MAPKILVFSLRSSHFRVGDGNFKIFGHVRIPRKYDLFVGDIGSNYKRFTYNLRAFICHRGAYPTPGPYVCFGMRSDKWYLFDDSTVTEMSEEEISNIVDRAKYAGDFYPY